MANEIELKLCFIQSKRNQTNKLMEPDPENLYIEEEEEEELEDTTPAINGYAECGGGFTDKGAVNPVYGVLERTTIKKLCCFANPVSGVIGESLVRHKDLKQIGELSMWKVYLNDPYVIIVPTKPALMSATVNTGLYQLRRLWEAITPEEVVVVDYQDGSVKTYKEIMSRKPTFSGDIAEEEERPKVMQLNVNEGKMSHDAAFPSLTQITGFSACLVTLAINDKVNCKCLLIRSHLGYITAGLLMKALSPFDPEIVKVDSFKVVMREAVSKLLRNQALYM